MCKETLGTAKEREGNRERGKEMAGGRQKETDKGTDRHGGIFIFLAQKEELGDIERQRKTEGEKERERTNE